MLSSPRIVLRGLRRTPAFTILAIAILTLGIGATTAMFSITRTILYKPLAYRQPDRLYSVMLKIPAVAKRYPTLPVNVRHYELWRDHERSFEKLALIAPSAHILEGAGEPEQISGVRATTDLFDLLGVHPRLGRAFTPQEGNAGHDHVAVISDRLWRRKFGADSAIIGKKIRLDGEPYEVVGVMPPAFPFPRGSQLSELEVLPNHAEYWIPAIFGKNERSDPLGNMNYLAIARLRPGVSQAQATAELASLEAVISKDFPERVEVDPVILPLQQELAGNVRRPLLVLLGAVGLVLLIVCLNLMNLMLVRATDRRHEWAIRLAVGGRLGHLIRDTMLESLVLSFAGGGLGCLLSVWLLALVRSSAPFDLPRLDELALDPVSLLFVLAASIASAFLFGMWPAWRAARIDPQEALQSSSRTSTEGRKGHRLGGALVSVEVALSVVVLLSAGLLLRSFVKILQVDPGMEVRHLVTAEIQLPPNQYRNASQTAGFYQRLMRQVRALPGVRAAGIVSEMPVTSENNVGPVTAGDRPIPPITRWPMTNMRSASHDYFETAGIPLVAGTIFQENDSAGADKEVLISQNLAARLWPGQDAVGRPLKGYGENNAWRVVGVVGAVHAKSLTEAPAMMIYRPSWRDNNTQMSLAVRTTNDPRSAAAVLRRTVAAIDPQVAVSNIRSMSEIISDSVAHRRFQLILLSAFAGVALVLACLGVYGVLSFAVSRRTSEIGIRMALGARPVQVLSSTLRQGLWPVSCGLLGGLLISASVGKLLEGLLFDVPVFDAVTYFGVSFALLFVGALACLLPAWRAAALNPVQALRHE